MALLSPRRTGRAGFPHPALAGAFAANLHRPTPRTNHRRIKPSGSSGH